MGPEDAVDFKDREEWRRWLEKNGNTSEGIWLVFYKKSSGKKGMALADAVEEALCFGWIDGKLKRIDNERHIIRYTPRRMNSVWSKINRERAESMILKGKMTAAGLSRVEGAKRSGAWHAAYTNLDREAMPDDLREALVSEGDAWKNFEGFANTYWNMYVGWVSSAKTEGTRKRRIRKVVEQASKNKNSLF